MTKLARIREAIVASLSDPRALAKALAIDRGATPNTTGLIVCCPWKEERTPSCSITRAPDGPGLRIHCFGCQQTADAIGLVAQVRGLSTRGREFVQVLREAATIAGRHDLVEELDAPPEERGKPSKRRRRDVPLELAPEPVYDEPEPIPELPPVSYPPSGEVRSLWQDAQPATEDHDAVAYLAGRGLSAAAPLVRVLHSRQELPRWTRYRGRTWVETGHRLLVCMFDASGIWRSVRAMRVAGDGDTPKRLPPTGFSVKGLAMANRAAIDMLRSAPTEPIDVTIVEGEPDWLTWATRYPSVPVFGIIGGSWHHGFATKIPKGSRVALRTHDDDAGDRFAATIAATLSHAKVRMR